MSDFPPMSLQIKPVQAQQPDPLQTLNQLMTIQGHMLDNTKKMNEQKSLMELGQIIATTDPEQQAEAIARSRAAIYNPQAVHSFIESKKSIVEIARERLAMTNSGVLNWGHDMAQMMSDPDLSPEKAQALIMSRAASYTDPVARQKYLDTAAARHESIFADWPSREEQLRDPNALPNAQARARQRIDGQVAGAVGSWDAIASAARGGTPVREGGMTYKDPLDRGPPVRMYPVRPGSPLTPPPAAPAPVAPVTIDPLSGMAAPAGGANALAPPGGPAAAAPADDSANALAPPGAPDAAAPPPVSIEPLAGTAAPAGAEVGSGQSMPPPAAAAPAPTVPAPGTFAPPPPPGVSPYLNPRTGQPVWGHGADTYSKVADWGGPTEIALSDGRLLSSQPYERLAKLKPTEMKDDGTLLYKNPADQKMVDKLDEEFGKEGVANENNHRLLGQIATMRDNFNILHKLGGWAEPGAYQDLKLQFYQAVKDIANVVAPDADIPALREGKAPTWEMALEGIRKIGIGMGYAATSQAFPGQREAMQTIQTSLGMVPNGAMSFRGANYVMRGMEMLAQRAIDQYTFKTNFRAANGNLYDADNAFNKEHSIRRMSEDVGREFGVGPDGFGRGEHGGERARDALYRGYITEREFDAHFAPRR